LAHLAGAERVRATDLSRTAAVQAESAAEWFRSCPEQSGSAADTGTALACPASAVAAAESAEERTAETDDTTRSLAGIADEAIAGAGTDSDRKGALGKEPPASVVAGLSCKAGCIQAAAASKEADPQRRSRLSRQFASSSGTRAARA